MTPYERQRKGEQFEGWAFTFCKAAFLVLLFQRYSLLILSGLSAAFYLLASTHGITKWKCWAKPPWVTVFWAAIFFSQVYQIAFGPAWVQHLTHFIAHGSHR